MIQQHRKWRTIKSFVRRQGRLTAAQAMTLDRVGSTYSLELEKGPPERIFSMKKPVFLEIGFGMGDSLLAMAQAYPERLYIGVEVYLPGISSLLHRLEVNNLENVFIYQADVVDVLSTCIPECSLEGVFIFFPDPWPKRKHRKRRLIQSDFIQLLSSRLRVGASIHLATDWEDYAFQMLSVLNAENNFRNLSPKGDFLEGAGERSPTKYEKRGEHLGHIVWDLYFVRK